jgi:hypothetical protein
MSVFTFHSQFPLDSHFQTLTAAPFLGRGLPAASIQQHRPFEPLSGSSGSPPRPSPHYRPCGLIRRCNMGRGLSEQQHRILKSARRRGYIYPWRAQQVVASLSGIRSRIEVFSSQDQCKHQATSRLGIEASEKKRNVIKASASRALTRLVNRGLLELQPASWKTFERIPGAIREYYAPARYRITQLGQAALIHNKRRALTNNHHEVNNTLVSHCKQNE